MGFLASEMFSAAVRPDIPGQVRWNIPQPIVKNTVDEYLALAERLRPQLDLYTAYLKESTGANIEFSLACVKSPESALRKLRDSTVCEEPQRIRDYLRVEGVIQGEGRQSIDDLDKVINYIKTAPETVGYKNQYEHPEPETGFRGFKSHTEIKDPDDPQALMSVEIIITHAGMKQANETTQKLRTMERQLRDIDSGLNLIPGLKNIAKFTQAREAIRAARKFVHDHFAHKTGVDSLVSIESRYISTVDPTRVMSTLNGSFKGIKRSVKSVLTCTMS